MALPTSPTAVTNSQLITLQPTGPASATALNPTFAACDPTNGNYFIATGRDLLTFFALPSTSAPAWNAMATYTTGQVVQSGSPLEAYIAIASVPANTAPPNATYWALYTSSTLTLYSAPDSCTGRTSDVVGYAVPDTGTVEFQVLPSSVFTQTTGHVIFQASSNLVQVNVSSL